jgi:hypothetical protein
LQKSEGKARFRQNKNRIKTLKNKGFAGCGRKWKKKIDF